MKVNGLVYHGELCVEYVCGNVCVCVFVLFYFTRKGNLLPVPFSYGCLLKFLPSKPPAWNPTQWIHLSVCLLRKG